MTPSAVSGMWNLAYDVGMGAGAFGFGMLVAQTGYPLGFALLGVLICAAGPLVSRDLARATAPAHHNAA